MRQYITRSDDSRLRIIEILENGADAKNKKFLGNYNPYNSHHAKSVEIDDSIYWKICNIIGDIVDKPISLFLKDESSHTDGKNIYLPLELDFAAKTISDDRLHYTLLEHELAHIVFESDSRNFEIFESWLDEYLQTYVDDYVTNSALDPQEEKQFRVIYENIDFKRISKAIINILEDYRIEYNWGQIYHGTVPRFIDCIQGIMEKQDDNINSQEFQDEKPLVDLMLVVRAFSNEISRGVAEPKFLNTDPDALFLLERFKALENKSANKTLVEARKIVKKLFSKILDMIKDSESPLNSPLTGFPYGKGCGLTDETDSIQDEGKCPACENSKWVEKDIEDAFLNHPTYTEKEIEELIEEYKNYDVESLMTCGSCDWVGVPKVDEKLLDNGIFHREEDKEIYEQRVQEIINLIREDTEECDNKIISCHGEMYSSKNFSEQSYHPNIKTKKLTGREKNLFEDDTEESEQILERVNQKSQERILDKIYEVIDPEMYEGTKTGTQKVIGKIMTTDKFNSYDRESTRNVDIDEVNTLKKFFSSVKAKHTIQLDEEGDSIDPEAYIQFRANPNMNEIFNNVNISQGLDVSLVIDCSGSMAHGNRIDDACLYAKTLHKALESLPNVKLNTWIFSGSKRDDLKTPVIKVSYDRLGNIWPEYNENIMTHTWNAVAHVANQMRGSTGKKLMILISDGMPQTANDTINETDATRESIEYAYLTGCKVFMIQVSGFNSEQEMTNLYGPRTNWVAVNGMDEAKKQLWSQVARAVYRTLIS